MFQINAARTAANTVHMVTTSVSTKPFPTVAATAPPSRAPVRLKNTLMKIAQKFQLKIVRFAIDRLQFIVHLACSCDVHALAQLLYHRQHRFGWLIDKLHLLAKTPAVQILRRDQNALPDFFDRL